MGKKKKGSAKKKKRDASSDSESDQKEEGLDWRVELLKKMKDIKNLPPEQLETEFKKAMAEKKRKEEEEKCIGEIKNRQKSARGRAKIPVARGRNIFPQDEERGRGRGRARVNNLYKRFKQQHRDVSSGGGERGELYNDGYGERRFEDGRSYSRSRSRSRGRKKTL